MPNQPIDGYHDQQESGTQSATVLITAAAGDGKLYGKRLQGRIVAAPATALAMPESGFVADDADCVVHDIAYASGASPIGVGDYVTGRVAGTTDEEPPKLIVEVYRGPSTTSVTADSATEIIIVGIDPGAGSVTYDTGVTVSKGDFVEDFLVVADGTSAADALAQILDLVGLSGSTSSWWWGVDVSLEPYNQPNSVTVDDGGKVYLVLPRDGTAYRAHYYVIRVTPGRTTYTASGL